MAQYQVVPTDFWEKLHRLLKIKPNDSFASIKQRVHEVVPEFMADEKNVIKLKDIKSSSEQKGKKHHKKSKKSGGFKPNRDITILQ